MEPVVPVTPVGQAFSLEVPERNRLWYEERGYEPYSATLFSQSAAVSDVVVDVGAHVGFYSLLARSSNPAARVVAVEASPDNAAVLSRNVATAGGERPVEVLHAAFGSRQGEAAFQITEASDNCSLTGHPNSPTIDTLVVPMICGEQLEIEAGNRVTVKIDVEGDELDALEGMRSVFSAASDVRLLVEFNPKCLVAAGTEPQAVVGWLRDNGFRLFAIDDELRSWSELKDLTAWGRLPQLDGRPSGYLNLYCLDARSTLTVSAVLHSSGTAGAESGHAELSGDLVRRGFMVHTVVPSPDHGIVRRLRRAGSSVSEVPPFAWWMHPAPAGAEPIPSLPAQLVPSSIVDEIRRVDADVVLTQTGAFAQGATAAAAAAKPHVWFLQEFGDKDQALQLPVPRADFGALVSSLSTRVLANSRAVADYFFGGDPDRVRVAYPIPQIAPVSEQVPPATTRWTLGVVGTLAPGKGQDCAVQAVALLRDTGLDVALVLVGESVMGPFAAELKEFVARLGLGDRVTFAGAVADRQQIYSLMNAVAVPSHSEAFGRVPFEATAFGRPVLYATAGGMTEYMTPGETGLGFPPRDAEALAAAVRQLLDDPSLGERLVTQARSVLLDPKCREAYVDTVVTALRDAGAAPVSPVAKVVGALTTLAVQNEALGAQNEALGAQNEALGAQNEALGDDLAAARLDARRTFDHAERVRWRAEQAAVARGVVQTQRDDARRTLETERNLLNGRLSEREADNAALYAHLDDVTGRLAAADGELAAIRAQVSWRLTRPLRALRSAQLRLFRRTPSGAPSNAARTTEHSPSAASPKETPAADEPHPAPPTAAPPGPSSAASTPEEIPPRGELPDTVADDESNSVLDERTTVGADDPPGADWDYYRWRYSDLAALTGDELRRHYQDFGRAEGRRVRPFAAEAEMPTGGLDPDRDTVLLLVHEASRTGAPILAWNIAGELNKTYNVVSVLLRGGELVGAFASVSAAVVDLGAMNFLGFVAAVEARELAYRLKATYQPLYAVANSSVTRDLVPPLEQNAVPVVALVHEFSENMHPVGLLSDLYETASEVIFPSDVVAASSVANYPQQLSRGYHLLPQGRAVVPPVQVSTNPGSAATVAALTGFKAAGRYIVIGMGTVIPRKGVEFFLQTAEMLRERHPEFDVVFVWVGCVDDASYSETLSDQIVRSRLQDRVAFLDVVDDPQVCYDAADVFFLSSRLDPMPNVAIDAACEGIPVVVFDQSTGIADWLAQDAELKQLVVPHLDTGAAADAVAALLDDPETRTQIGATIRARASSTFQMAGYVHRIDELGRAAHHRRVQEEIDLAAIAGSGAFNAQFYAGSPSFGSEQDQIEAYLDASRMKRPRARPHPGSMARRPYEGFNPFAYAERYADYDEDLDGDPFADFLARGRPEGPWLHPVIEPASDGAARPAMRLKVLVHGHFHYPELAEDFLHRLAVNDLDASLVLTTPSRQKARELATICAANDVVADDILVVPNRGRDIGPLLTGLGHDMVSDFDLLLHVHGKKSPHPDWTEGDQWRVFLWENLIGGIAPMADRVHDAFVSDPGLGLVFAEDAYVRDWDGNRSIAESVLRRAGLSETVPNHFDFPLGTMFWARPRALEPLFALGLTWEDYPQEPVAKDGTILHALERVLTFSCLGSGLTLASSYVPGTTRYRPVAN